MCDLNLKPEEAEFIKDDPRCINPECGHLALVHRLTRPGTVYVERFMACLMSACPCIDYSEPKE